MVLPFFIANPFGLASTGMPNGYYEHFFSPLLPGREIMTGFGRNSKKYTWIPHNYFLKCQMRVKKSPARDGTFFSVFQL
jgi:hypothetical protein